jgi:hypothetical protein
LNVSVACGAFLYETTRQRLKSEWWWVMSDEWWVMSDEWWVKTIFFMLTTTLV